MRSQIRPALMVFFSLSILTGVAYPLLVMVAAKTLFAKQASGSIIVRDGRPIGSELIGQPFTGPRYFWSRPSATSPVPYAGSAGAGSNLSASNPALVTAVQERVSALQNADPGNTLPIPVDLITASGSGLDPHISIAAARYQVSRVARARGLSTDTLMALIAQATEGRTIGVLGEPRVNVLRLNLSLDARS